MSNALLEVSELVAGYGELPVLRGVSLRAGAEEIVAVVGPNGAGKSTLLKAVHGVLRPSQGSVRFRGEDVTGLRPDRLTRRGMNVVPQLDNVFPTLSVLENLQVSALPVARAKRRAAIENALEMFPALRDVGRRSAGRLSGGQRKLLALARAVVTQPVLLLLDEPSAGLSPQALELVFGTIAEINHLGVSIVIVEQNARRALGIAHTGYVLDMGRNAYVGSGTELLKDPRLSELYLGGAVRT